MKIFDKIKSLFSLRNPQHYNDNPDYAYPGNDIWLKIKPTDKDGQGLVAQTAKEELRVCLRKKENVLLNSTNITKNMRTSWIDLALLYNAKINIVYIDCSLEQALKQNKEREAALPETIIERLSRKLEIPQLSECHKLTIINK